MGFNETREHFRKDRSYGISGTEKEQNSIVTAFRGRSSLTWHVVIDRIKMLKNITYRKETK